jgi:hypothetical protein
MGFESEIIPHDLYDENDHEFHLFERMGLWGRNEGEWLTKQARRDMREMMDEGYDLDD